MTAAHETLKTKFDDRTAVIGVIGLGYVGLPLVRAFHNVGYPVLGFDVDPSKIKALEVGQAYLKHLGDELMTTLAQSERFEATADFSRLNEVDAVLICVPTPLGPHREPDLSFVEKTAETIAQRGRPGQHEQLSKKAKAIYLDDHPGYIFPKFSIMIFL